MLEVLALFIKVTVQQFFFFLASLHSISVYIFSCKDVINYRSHDSIFYPTVSNSQCHFVTLEQGRGDTEALYE